jgi:serine/threonine-protein kinase RsbW
MNQKSRETVLWAKRYELSSVPEAVEPVCTELRNALEGQGMIKYDFSACILLREAFANAAKHGNRSDPAKTVCCEITLETRALRIKVSDQGVGFDWRTATERPSATIQNDEESLGLRRLREDGRGLSIYRHYADTVQFNASGNEVSLKLRMGA